LFKPAADKENVGVYWTILSMRKMNVMIKPSNNIFTP